MFPQLLQAHLVFRFLSFGDAQLCGLMHKHGATNGEHHTHHRQLRLLKGDTHA